MISLRGEWMVWKPWFLEFYQAAPSAYRCTLCHTMYLDHLRKISPLTNLVPLVKSSTHQLVHRRLPTMLKLRLNLITTPQLRRTLSLTVLHIHPRQPHTQFQEAVAQAMSDDPLTPNLRHKRSNRPFHSPRLLRPTARSPSQKTGARRRSSYWASVCA